MRHLFGALVNQCHSLRVVDRATCPLEESSTSGQVQRTPLERERGISFFILYRVKITTLNDYYARNDNPLEFLEPPLSQTDLKLFL